MEIPKDKVRKYRKKAHAVKIPRQRLIAYALFDTIEKVLKIGTIYGRLEGWAWKVKIGEDVYACTDSDFRGEGLVYSTCDGWIAFGKNHKQAATKIVAKLKDDVQHAANVEELKNEWLAAAEKGLAAIA